MKAKLSKRTHELEQSVEAYINCACFCGCTCTAIDPSEYGYLLEVKYNGNGMRNIADVINK